MAHDADLREIPLTDEPVFDGKLLRVSRMRVRLPNGQTSLREIVRHNGGVGIVPIDSQGNVTLVRQYRIAVDQLTLEVPAGKLDSAAENPLAAAQRELEEETGLRAGRMELLTVSMPTPGYSTERLYLYLATELSQHQAHLDADEFLGVAKMPLKEALSRVMSGEVTDGKTALALLMAEQKLRLEGILPTGE